MAKNAPDPEVIKERARAKLAELRGAKDDPYYKAYFDKSFDPVMHETAVRVVAQLSHLAEHGSVEFEDGTVNPAFMDKGEAEEIVREQQSARLAKRGVTASDMQVAEDSDDGDSGERSLEDLRNDPEFMDRYMNGWAEGHDEAVAEYTTAFRADQSGGTDDGDED